VATVAGVPAAAARRRAGLWGKPPCSPPISASLCIFRLVIETLGLVGHRPSPFTVGLLPRTACLSRLHSTSLSAVSAERINAFSCGVVACLRSAADAAEVAGGGELLSLVYRSRSCVHSSSSAASWRLHHVSRQLCSRICCRSRPSSQASLLLENFSSHELRRRHLSSGILRFPHVDRWSDIERQCTATCEPLPRLQPSDNACQIQFGRLSGQRLIVVCPQQIALLSLHGVLPA
jgi:hypothetical protein